MPFDFKGKVCVITGAGRGIGRVLCRDFAAEGGLVVGCSRSPGPLDSLNAEITSAGGRFLPIPADLSRVEECERLIGETTQHFGPVDVLVNNLGITGAHKPIRDLQPAEWFEALNTNLTSVYACTHFAVGAMMERKSGAIVNVSSIGPKIHSPFRVPYAATKMGMVGITRVLSQELGPYNIRVNTVSPGAVEGERSLEVWEHMSRTLGITVEEARDRITAQAALRRTLPPEDISATIRFLCSDLGRSITGQDISVDCGVAFQ
jgi:NAD(P)-dependent dehydrogenase (short-subunit alcohol dehydrogenase family)